MKKLRFFIAVSALFASLLFVQEGILGQERGSGGGRATKVIRDYNDHLLNVIHKRDEYIPLRPEELREDENDPNSETLVFFSGTDHFDEYPPGSEGGIPEFDGTVIFTVFGGPGFDPENPVTTGMLRMPTSLWEYKDTGNGGLFTFDVLDVFNKYKTDLQEGSDDDDFGDVVESGDWIFIYRFVNDDGRIKETRGRMEIEGFSLGFFREVMRSGIPDRESPVVLNGHGLTTFGDEDIFPGSDIGFPVHPFSFDYRMDASFGTYHAGVIIPDPIPDGGLSHYLVVTSPLGPRVETGFIIRASKSTGDGEKAISRNFYTLSAATYPEFECVCRIEGDEPHEVEVGTTVNVEIIIKNVSDGDSKHTDSYRSLGLDGYCALIVRRPIDPDTGEFLLSPFLRIGNIGRTSDDDGMGGDDTHDKNGPDLIEGTYDDIPDGSFLVGFRPDYSFTDCGTPQGYNGFTKGNDSTEEAVLVEAGTGPDPFIPGTSEGDYTIKFQTTVLGYPKSRKIQLYVDILGCPPHYFVDQEKCDGYHPQIPFKVGNDEFGDYDFEIIFADYDWDTGISDIYNCNETSCLLEEPVHIACDKKVWRSCYEGEPGPDDQWLESTQADWCEVVWFKIAVENAAGSDKFIMVTVEDTLPAGLGFIEMVYGPDPDDPPGPPCLDPTQETKLKWTKVLLDPPLMPDDPPRDILIFKAKVCENALDMDLVNGVTRLEGFTDEEDSVVEEAEYLCEATVIPQKPDISLKISVKGNYELENAVICEKVRYTLEIENTGHSNLKPLPLTVVLPPELDYIIGSAFPPPDEWNHTLKWYDISEYVAGPDKILNPGEKSEPLVTFDVCVLGMDPCTGKRVRVEALVVGEVYCADPEYTECDVGDTREHFLDILCPDVSVKTSVIPPAADPSADVCSIVEFSIIVTNESQDVDLKDVQVKAILNKCLGYCPSSSSRPPKEPPPPPCHGGDTEIEWEIPFLEKGTQEEITYEAVVCPDWPGECCGKEEGHSVTVKAFPAEMDDDCSGELCSDTDEASAALTIKCPEITVTKSCTPSTVEEGDTVEFTIIVENTGDPVTGSCFDSVRLVDVLDRDLGFVQVTVGDDPDGIIPGVGCHEPREETKVIWENLLEGGDTFCPGEVYTITYEAVVCSGARVGEGLCNNATATGSLPGIDYSDDCLVAAGIVEGECDAGSGDQCCVVIPPPIPTLTEWGLILLAAFLGFFLVLRNRRRVFSTGQAGGSL